MRSLNYIQSQFLYEVAIMNRLLTSNQLTLKDKGLLLALLAESDGFKFKPTWLAKNYPDSEGVIRRCLKNLESAGLVKHVKQTNTAKGGKGGSLSYWVKEKAALVSENVNPAVGYTKINKAVLISGALNFKEAALLAYLHSKVFYLHHAEKTAEALSCGLHQVKSGLAKLKQLGAIRVIEQKGNFNRISLKGYEVNSDWYQVFKSCEKVALSTSSKDSKKPKVEKRHVENQPLLNDNKTKVSLKTISMREPHITVLEFYEIMIVDLNTLRDIIKPFVKNQRLYYYWSILNAFKHQVMFKDEKFLITGMPLKEWLLRFRGYVKGGSLKNSLSHRVNQAGYGISNEATKKKWDVATFEYAQLIRKTSLSKVQGEKHLCAALVSNPAKLVYVLEKLGMRAPYDSNLKAV